MNQHFSEATPEREPVNDGSFRHQDYEEATKENQPNETRPCKAYTSSDEDWSRAAGANCLYCGHETFQGKQISGHFVCLPCSVELEGIKAKLENSRCCKRREVRVVRGEQGSVICDVDWDKGTAKLISLRRGNRWRSIENIVPGSTPRVAGNVANYLAKDWSFHIEVTRRVPSRFPKAGGKGQRTGSRFVKTASALKGVRGTVVDPETGRVLPRIAYELKRKLKAGDP